MNRYPLPPVSIITVVYNGAKHLERTIESVVSQMHEHEVEYIIIDGGSTDGTVDVIRRHQEQLSYWVSEPDEGIYDAMNKGWVLARDDSFVLFLGAGDEVISLPKSVDDYIGEVVYGRVYVGERMFQPKVDFRLRIANTLHHQGLLVHKSVCESQPFNRDYKVYADFDFNQRLLKQKVRWGFSDTFLTRAMPGGLSNKHYVRESLRVIHSNFGLVWTLLAILYKTCQGVRTGFRGMSLSSNISGREVGL